MASPTNKVLTLPASPRMTDIRKPVGSRPGGAPEPGPRVGSPATPPSVRMSDITAPEAAPEPAAAPEPPAQSRSAARPAGAQLVAEGRRHQTQARRELDDARRLTGAVPPPSGFRYKTGFTLAIILDLVDILTTIGAITGVVWVVGVVIDTLFGIFVVKWVSQGYATAEDLQRNSVESQVQLVEQRGGMLTRATMSRAQRSGTGQSRSAMPPPPIPQSVGRKLPGASKSIGRRFNPARRVAYSTVVDCIPLVELLPMKCLMLRSLRKDHERAFRESAGRLQEFVNAQARESDAFSRQQELVLWELTNRSAELHAT